MRRAALDLHGHERIARGRNPLAAEVAVGSVAIGGAKDLRPARAHHEIRADMVNSDRGRRGRRDRRARSTRVRLRFLLSIERVDGHGIAGQRAG